LQTGARRLIANPSFYTWKLSAPVAIQRKPFTYGFTITGPSDHLLLRKKGYWERIEMEVLFYDAGMAEVGSKNVPSVGIRFEIKRQFAVKSPESVEPSIERFEKDSDSRLEDKSRFEDLEFLDMLAKNIIPAQSLPL
jgi:hypothetical protein